MLPNVNKDFILHTNASGFATGAVLSLKDAETKYRVFEKVLLAIVWGVANFRQYLYGRHFALYCD